MACIRKPARAKDEPLDTRPGMPRWVKIFLITTAALLGLLVLAMALSGGQHGPARHLSAPSLVSAMPSPVSLMYLDLATELDR